MKSKCSILKYYALIYVNKFIIYSYFFNILFSEIAYVHFLRLVTHLILYLRDLMLPTSDKESYNIIKLYTELLIEYRQVHFIYFTI